MSSPLATSPTPDQKVPNLLGLAQGSSVGKWNPCWTSAYINWKVDNLGLCFASGFSWENCPGFNCLEAFMGQSIAPSPYQWEKNTHRCVNYNGQIIFAYCCPSRSSHLCLGLSKYRKDEKGNPIVIFQRKFISVGGKSFGSLTNCSRIISMGLKNDHLWITFMSADNTQYRYFHARAKDIQSAMFKL
jgi:hypothetical protein